MNSNDLFQFLKAPAAACLVAASFAPAPGISQPSLESIADRERQLVAAIEQEEARNGPNSEALIGPLTDLSLFYDEIGAYESADAASAP